MRFCIMILSQSDCYTWPFSTLKAAKYCSSLSRCSQLFAPTWQTHLPSWTDSRCSYPKMILHLFQQLFNTPKPFTGSAQNLIFHGTMDSPTCVTWFIYLRIDTYIHTHTHTHICWSTHTYAHHASHVVYITHISSCILCLKYRWRVAPELARGVPIYIRDVYLG